MSRIVLIQPGQPVANFSINGTVISVGGYSVDAAERQADTAIRVEIRLLNGTATEGDAGAYLAFIDIPAREYVDLPAATPADETSGLPGSFGHATTTRQAVPLDPNAVVVTLWPTTA